MKGLTVNVYRTHYDCTNNGISSRHNCFILCDETIPEIFEETENNPPLILIKRKLNTVNSKDGKHYIHAVPLKNGKPATGGMFGGNFVYSSDGRFPGVGPIPIHDRFE